MLYNLHRGRAIPNLDELILCEGFFDVIEWYERGWPNAVALMGSTMSEDQMRLIIETVGWDGKVMLVFDDDPAGRMCTGDTLTRLSQHVYVKVGIVS